MAKAKKKAADKKAALVAKAAARAEEIREEKEIEAMAKEMVKGDAVESNLKTREQKLKDHNKEIKPNKYDSAVKAVKDMEGVDIPEKIKSIEKEFYHILAVRSQANNKTLKFVHTSNVIKMRTHAWNKHKKAHKGVQKMVIFHNPSV